MFRVSSSSGNRGAALVLTLFLVSLLVVMVMGYMEVSRSDMTHSHQNLERVRAESIAREGLDTAVGKMRREILNPPRYNGETDVNYEKRQRNWISQPGRLIVPSTPNDSPTNTSVNQKQLRSVVELSSGVPSPSITYTRPIFEPAELNLQLLTQQNPPDYLITSKPHGTTGRPHPMELRWVYVRQTANGPEYDTSDNPDLSVAGKPIIGRFAWWVDDESTKINFNLAWKRTPQGSLTPNKNTAAHPSNINLMALQDAEGNYLSEAMADTLHQWTNDSPKRFFNSFADVRQSDRQLVGISKFLKDNQFEVTHYNHDPDLTFFGEERILLTTNPDLVPRNPDGSFARRFLNILREDLPAGVTPDPGLRQHIAGGQLDPESGKVVANKLNPTLTMLIDYLNRNTWPMAPGLTFRDKYFPGASATDSRLGQFALKIIDYVRAKESAEPLVAPLRVGKSGGAYTTNADHVYLKNTIQGMGRSPMFTEIGVGMPGTFEAIKNLGTYHDIFFKVELHLPKDFNIPEGIDLSPESGDRWYLSFSEMRMNYYCHRRASDGAVRKVGNSEESHRIEKSDIFGGAGPDGTILMPGGYVVITKRFLTSQKWKAGATVQGRVALYKNIAEVEGKDGFGSKTAAAQADVYCMFPHLANEHGDDFFVDVIDTSSGVAEHEILSRQTNDPRSGVHALDWSPMMSNTFGRKNSTNRVGEAPDVTDINIPQQDTDANGNLSDHSLYMPPPKGVGSNGVNGDNGRVTSVGELGYVDTGANAVERSVSWRSLRLQPNRYANTDKLPDWVLLDLFSVPNADSASRNHLTNPHGTSVGGRININSRVEPFTDMDRDRGLVGLLLGANRVKDLAQAEAIASNIYRFELAPDRNGSFGKAYGYPWATTAIDAYDVTGEICEIAGLADDGEEGEDRVRSLISNVTTRGGVFSIYTVGQSLVNKNGTLDVTAEQRFHSVVEFFRNTFGTDTADDDRMDFRTIYLRKLVP